MSWSLKIEHGDLSSGGKGLSTVSGGGKLTQDLTCAVLEPMGTDPLHPTFGSIIDGGTDTAGQYQPGIIGHPNDDLAAAFVSSEIRRLCHTYQGQQIARNAADVAVYGKSTLTIDEDLLSLIDVSIQAIADSMLVTATLETGSGVTPLSIPFTSA